MWPFTTEPPRKPDPPAQFRVTMLSCAWCGNTYDRMRVDHSASEPPTFRMREWHHRHKDCEDRFYAARRPPIMVSYQ